MKILLISATPLFHNNWDKLSRYGSLVLSWADLAEKQISDLYISASLHQFASDTCWPVSILMSSLIAQTSCLTLGCERCERSITVSEIFWTRQMSIQTNVSRGRIVRQTFIQINCKMLRNVGLERLRKRHFKSVKSFNVLLYFRT